MVRLAARRRGWAAPPPGPIGPGGGAGGSVAGGDAGRLGVLCEFVEGGFDLLHHLDLFLEDLAVDAGLAVVREGGAVAEVLAERLGPAALAAAGYADEDAAVGDVIEDGGFFGDADRASGAAQRVIMAPGLGPTS